MNITQEQTSNSMKPKRYPIKSADEFEDYADELLIEWMKDFPQRGLTRQADEDDYDRFGSDDVVSFVYTQKAMILYDNACRRLQAVGEKMFPEDVIEVKNTEIIWP
jgi:hypothetical protein